MSRNMNLFSWILISCLIAKKITIDLNLFSGSVEDEMFEYEMEYEPARLGQAAQFTAEEFRRGEATWVNKPSLEFQNLLSKDSSSNTTSWNGTTLKIEAAVPFTIPQSTLGMIIAIVAILLGFLSTFWGRSHFTATMFAVGSSMFGMISYLLIEKLKAMGTLSATSNMTIVYGAGIGGSALVGGILFACLRSFASMILSLIVGFLAGCFILEIQVFSIFSFPVRLAIVALTTVLGGIFSAYFRYTIFFSTSFLGSFLIFAGIDYFIPSGFIGVLVLNASNHFINFVTLGMIGGFILLGLIGTAIQFREQRVSELKNGLPQTYSGTPKKDNPKESDLQKQARAVEAKYRARSVSPVRRRSDVP